MIGQLKLKSFPFVLRQFLLILSCGICVNAVAQQRSDSVAPPITVRIKKLIQQAIEKNAVEYNEERVGVKREEIFELAKINTRNLKNYLKPGIDSIQIRKELSVLAELNLLAGDGVFTNIGSAQSYRNLVITSKLLQELQNRAIDLKVVLDSYDKNLLNFKTRSDSLLVDSVMYRLPEDSASLMRYIQKILVIAQEIAPVDTVMDNAIITVELLQNRANLIVDKLGSDLEETYLMQRKLSDVTLRREFGNLGAPVAYSRPFRDIIKVSGMKEQLEFYYYGKKNLIKILLFFALIIASFIFIRSLKNHVVRDGALDERFTGQLVLRYPLLSAILIVTSLYQFAFIHPPFLFNMILWSVSAICLTVIFRGIISSFWMLVWLAVFAFFLLAGVDNLILQASRSERWYMLTLSSLAVFASSIILIKGDQTELKEKWIVYFIGLGMILEFGSILLNVFGRYNLSKTLFVSGFVNGIIAILFLWTVRLINEGLTLAVNVYKTPDRKLFYINFNRVGSSVSPLFNVMLIAGWFILFGQNFYAFGLIANPVEKFLLSTRTIGNYSFSISTLLVFFLILLVAWVVSSIVSFFASDRPPQQSDTGPGQRHGRGLGSWLLLIRIAIFSIGLFLAFAATGLPVDRIAIVLGALSVGIGFGLQSIVQSLVSGVIISFERQVSVGDIVEIGNQEGTIKSIGFRSSILSTSEGADIVIPNGDLLNQRLVNWTHGKTTRRVDIMFSVADGTNLKELKTILQSLAAADERINKFPEPTIIAKQFGNNSIEIHLNFWLHNIREYPEVRSDMITEIDDKARLNKIVIH